MTRLVLLPAKTNILAFSGYMVVSGKLPTYLSPNLTLTLTSFFGQMLGLGRGRWEVSQKRLLIPFSYPARHNAVMSNTVHLIRVV